MIDLNKLMEIAQEKENDKLQPGGYICQIKSVENVESKQYFEINYDIAMGEHEHYFAQQSHTYNNRFWPGKLFVSYNPNDSSRFMMLMKCLKESNKDASFSGDEQCMVGKQIGLVLQEEEYLDKYKTPKVRMRVAEITSVDKIRCGDYGVYGKRELKK